MLYGQYPYEKYPAIKYKEYSNWKTYDRVEKEHKLHYTLTIPGFYSNSDSITVQFTISDSLGYSTIRIYKNKKQIHRFKEFDAFYGLTEPLSIFVADYNNDGLMDIKFLVPSHGCGAYNYYTRVIYLLQNADNNFKKVSYTDLFIDFENRLERDFDGDGNYEVITQTFKNYKQHNYWLFNLYNFADDNLVNVNYKDNYPIMIQLLYRDNFEVTNKISRDKMKDFSMILPDDYKDQYNTGGNK